MEGGRIDHGLHDTKPRRALEELVAFEQAVEAALNMVNLETNTTGVQAIVVCPTREIAVQGASTILEIASRTFPDLKVSTLIGGMSVSDDAIKLT